MGLSSQIFRVNIEIYFKPPALLVKLDISPMTWHENKRKTQMLQTTTPWKLNSSPPKIGQNPKGNESSSNPIMAFRGEIAVKLPGCNGFFMLKINDLCILLLLPTRIPTRVFVGGAQTIKLFSLPKTNEWQAGKTTMNEDVSPINNGVIYHCHVSFQGGYVFCCDTAHLLGFATG